jgi:hypothetical protein
MSGAARDGGLIINKARQLAGFVFGRVALGDLPQG